MFDWYRRPRSPIWTIIGICTALIPLTILGVRAFLGAAPFVWKQSRAMQLCQACSSAPVDGAKPYRLGRVLVAQRNGIALGAVMANEALAGITASTPGEVGTLISVGDVVAVQEGTFRGVTMMRYYRDVCLINWQTGAVYFRTSLAGAPPAIST